ncbi:MAG TPA: phytanoyl-CoA dioxygenase family protein [Pyrinomonadaceae bacterium]|jgi:phytanoyl-CoA hydroxylase|nr:phytanoyl-CoA dioxygenase family protein [Pyrinomonadaceae bacterium]
MTITPEQLSNYYADGFLVLDNFADHNRCDALRSRAAELVAEFDPAGLISIFSTQEQNRLADEYFLTSGDKIRFFFEENAFRQDGTLKQEKEKSINKIGHALHDLDPVFNRFSRNQKVQTLTENLGIEKPLLLQSMYIFKQPNIGGEVSCHQDSTFLYNEPIDIVGLWFALEDATIENGCLWVIPGGHKHGLKSRWIRSATGAMEFKTYDSEPWPEGELVPLEVQKGSLIVLQGLLPHRSLENKSANSRHAYTLHIIGGKSVYASDNWLQPPSSMPLRGF